MNKNQGLVLLLALCLTACATPPAQTSARPKDATVTVDTNYAGVYAHDAATGGFVHLGSQMVLPQTLNGWQNVSEPSRISPAAAFGISYKKGRSVMTAYIKESNQAVLEGIAISTVIRVNMTGERRVQLGVVKRDPNEKQPANPGFYCVITAVSSATKHELAMTYPVDKYVLKLRLSAEGMTDQEAQAQLIDFAEGLLHWKPIFDLASDKIEAR